MFANAPGKEVLRLFRNAHTLTSLRAALNTDSTTEEPSSAPAVLLTAPGGRRFYVRIKPIPSRGLNLLVFSEEVVRTQDLNAVLQRRYSLSPRESDIAGLVRAGMSNQEIADRMKLAVSTVKQHLSRVFIVLDVNSRTQLIVLMNRLASAKLRQ